MRRLILAIVVLLAAADAVAFCGFYVAKADTKLFNKASKVVLVRDGDRTVLTMANDFQGDPKEFAIVIPVPTFLEKGQIHVGEPAVIDHLDAYTSPRLVEYFDENPCDMRRYRVMEMGAPQAAGVGAKSKSDSELGVKVEARYTVGEYDILILSAEESDGLETWLRENGYKIPNGASSVLGSYIKQKMRFFVAKVNLEEQAKAGFKYLRPLQVAYESHKFMLPIRLGTLNAEGDQELFVFALTRKGRIETTNYRTVKLPEGVEIPTYVKEEFPEFYKAMFAEQVKRENKRAVFLEYAWDMGWCDPCAADPLSNEELKKLGVFWLNDAPDGPQTRMAPQFGGSPVFVTRLHLRYNSETFPEDLMFQETSDKSNFQGRYVLRHAWKGSDTCSEAETYRRNLPNRYRKEAETLANLTGWDIEKIRAKMGVDAKDTPKPNDKWWEKIW